MRWKMVVLNALITHCPCPQDPHLAALCSLGHLIAKNIHECREEWMHAWKGC
jgi:hypothetical protein